MAPESSWIDRFYSHFIGRDFAYLSAGGLFISAVEYALWNKILLPQQLSLELIGFLSISYFIGIVINDFGRVIRLYSEPIPADSSDYYTESLIFEQQLLDNYNNNIINHYERLVFQRVIGTSIGSSSVFGGIFMIGVVLIRWLFESIIPSVDYIGLTISLLIFGIYMIYIAKKTMSNIQFQENFFRNDLNKEKKKI